MNENRIKRIKKPFKTFRALSIIPFTKILDMVFSNTLTSKLLVVDLFVLHKIFLKEGYFWLNVFIWSVASNIFSSILFMIVIWGKSNNDYLLTLGIKLIYNGLQLTQCKGISWVVSNILWVDGQKLKK